MNRQIDAGPSRLRYKKREERLWCFRDDSTDSYELLNERGFTFTKIDFELTVTISLNIDYFGCIQ